MPAYERNDDTATRSSPAGGRAWQNTGSVAKPEETRRKALYALRASVRQVTGSGRTRECGRAACRAEGPAIEVTHRSDGATARWLGTLTCGHRWTCPVCSTKLVAERRTQIIDALAAGRAEEPGREWQMLTLTVRHDSGMALAHLLRGLKRAWRTMRQRGTIQRLWKEHVAASVRAIEVTDGEHGWHPHIHVLLLTTNWTDEELAVVAKAWKQLVTRYLGVACSPNEAHGTHWSGGGDDTYLAKLGLEVTGAAKENSAWAHADAAAERYAVARKLTSRSERARIYAQGDVYRARFREYEDATKGCRAIELDDRAARLARRGEEMRLSYEPAETTKPPTYEVAMTEVVDTPLGPLSLMRVLRVLEKDDRCVFCVALDVAARAPPGAAAWSVRAWLEAEMAVRFAPWPTHRTGLSSATQC